MPSLGWCLSVYNTSIPLTKDAEQADKMVAAVFHIGGKGLCFSSLDSLQWWLSLAAQQEEVTLILQGNKIKASIKHNALAPPASWLPVAALGETHPLATLREALGTMDFCIHVHQ